MQNEIAVSPSRLSDAELIARVKSLAERERDATAQLIAHLAELAPPTPDRVATLNSVWTELSG